MDDPTEVFNYDEKKDGVFADFQPITPENQQYPIVPGSDSGVPPQPVPTPTDQTELYTEEAESTKLREDIYAWLVAIAGDMKGQVKILQRNNMIGRIDKAEICIKDAFVSEMHATVAYRDGAFYAWDLGSLNGSKLNGEPLLSAVKLNDGDKLEFGKQVFIFKWIDPAIIESLKA